MPLQHLVMMPTTAQLAILPGPTSQDAETPSYYGLNPFCYIVNAGGGTRSDSEFRHPEMWALSRLTLGVSKALKI
jgi:hypothetical protein